ncbi:hypothetical protein B0H16DRAFT_1878588 [Mycena metata]|uniref:Uncharacterized protein n=1 Tax=Mycena metata TaxID=1033252 RepID=A0AAD7K5P7_9AGAR|nr:hypothetical protein B0H16DRAFT_1878588 [Mycena metata]
MDRNAITQFQRTSTELVVYSRLAERVVTISWPKHKGALISPKGVKAWLRNRGLFLECFCAFTAQPNQPRSIQLVVGTITGHVFGFCHFSESRCGFRVDLTRIPKSAVLNEKFPHLPMLITGNTPDMDSLRVSFMLQRFPSTEVAPHFVGYFGEHISYYPTGTHQESGALLLRRRSTQVLTRRHSSPYARQQRQAPASNPRYLEIDEIYPTAGNRLVAKDP